MKRSALLALYALSSFLGLALPLAAQPAAPARAVPPTGELPERRAGGTPAEPEPARLELAGKVYLGSEPRAARLEFLTGSGEKVEATADAGGSYRLRALGPLRKVTIELKGREGHSFQEFFYEPLRVSGQRDFHLPATELRVKIFDAVSGKPVPKAFLKLRNTFPLRGPDGQPLPPKRPGAEPPSSALSQSVESGADGVAVAYYLHPGHAEIQAGADGYTAPATPQKLEIATGGRLTAEIRLQPEGEKAALRVLLPNGEKAAGAAVLVLATLEPMQVLSAGVADREGRIELPKDAAGAHLAVRHPEAAFHIGRWRPAEGAPETRLQLEPAAEPLAIHAKTAAGDLAYAEVALVIGGQRLTTHLLYQLTGSSPMTDDGGIWKATSLPRQPLEVLVFGRQNAARAAAIRSGQGNAPAIAVSYPWSGVVEVEGIE